MIDVAIQFHASKSEANSHSVSQIPCILWNPKVYYHIHKGPAAIPILSQMYPVHTLPPYSPKIHSNIIFSYTPRSSKWSLPFRFFNQNIVCISHLSHPCYMPPSHPLSFNYPNNIRWSITSYEAPRYAVCSSLPLPSALLRPHILLSTPFLNTFNLCSSLTVRDTAIQKMK